MKFGLGIHLGIFYSTNQFHLASTHCSQLKEQLIATA